MAKTNDKVSDLFSVFDFAIKSSYKPKAKINRTIANKYPSMNLATCIRVSAQKALATLPAN
ncbi:MAG: hypothetical protein ACI9FO_001424, partial [Methylophagaceae bacterium]|jgi:hypothetical protein